MRFPAEWTRSSFVSPQTLQLSLVLAWTQMLLLPGLLLAGWQVELLNTPHQMLGGWWLGEDVHRARRCDVICVASHSLRRCPA